MSFFQYYRCSQCEKEYDSQHLIYLCPECGRDYSAGIPLPGILECVFDYASIAQAWADFIKENPDAGIERRIHKLCEIFSPVDLEHYPNLPVGNSPLIPGTGLGIKNLYLKFDGLNPSGSFKDRASALMVAEAKRRGIKEIVTASTGNAASSLAALCAASGIKAVIFAPANAPKAKLVQIKVHGATLNLINGSYDDAYKEAMKYSLEHDCLNRNTAYHPFTIEGKKTAGLEIFAQLGQLPDYIFVPTGDGAILSGLAKAFADLLAARMTDHLPALIAAQAESSDAICSYWETGIYQDAKEPKTVADSISVKTPAAAHLAYRVLHESDGMGIRVNDTEILAAQKMLASRTGIFCEPASASALAAFFQAKEQGWIKDNSKVVLMITGHGLKDIEAVKDDT